MKCVSCGNLLRDTAKVCIKCGAVIAGANSNPSLSNKSIISGESESQDSRLPHAESAPPNTNSAPDQLHAQPLSGESHGNFQNSNDIRSELPVIDGVVEGTALAPRVEVSPAFSSDVRQVQANKRVYPTKSGSKYLLGFGVICLIVVVVLLSNRFGTSENSAEKEPEGNRALLNAPAKEKKYAAQEPDKGIAESEKRTLSRDTLNEMMQAAELADWSKVRLAALGAVPEQMAAVNPKEATKFNASGLKSLKDGNYDVAIENFKSGILRDATNPEIKNNLGFAYLKSGQIDLARQSIMEALLVDPTRGVAWFNASEIFSRAGNERAARRALKLSVYFARDQEKVKQFLASGAGQQSEDFSFLIKSSLVELKDVPRFER